MVNSFVICHHENSDISTKVKKLHINIWEISFKTCFLEFGILFNFDKNEFFSHENVKIKLITPFAIKNDNLKNIFSFLNEESIKLIFNDKINSLENYDKGVGINYAKLISFGKPEKDFVLVDATIEKIDNNSLVIIFDPRKIKDEYLDDNFNVYIRCRYEIDQNACNNIIKENNFTCRFINYDLRFNDLRQFSTNEIRNFYDKIIKCDKIYFFILNNLAYKPKLIDNFNLKYERILELELFKNYLPEIKKMNYRYMVHYWQITPENGDNSCVLTTSFEIEKKVLTISFIALLTNIIAAIIYYDVSNTETKLYQKNSLKLIILCGLIYIVDFFLQKYKTQKIISENFPISNKTSFISQTIKRLFKS